jgi:hypothetical protein
MARHGVETQDEGAADGEGSSENLD